MPQKSAPASADQHIRRFGPSWPPTAEALTRTDTTLDNTLSQFSTPNYDYRNGLFAFDTGSILPDGATVTACTLRVVTQAKANTNTRNFVGEYYAWDGTSDTDWSATIPGSPIFSVTVASIAAAGGTNDIPITDLSGISTTGETRIRTFIDYATAPTASNQVAVHSLENTGSFIVPTLIIDYTDGGATETLVPVAGGAVTNLSTYDATAIDEHPDTGDANWLTGTDPSAQAGLTNGPEYVDAPASSTAWTGGTAATWTTYANVIDTSESTNTAVTLTSTNTDYQNWFTFAAGDWTDLPTDAVITGMSVTVRSSIGTAARVQHHVALGTTNGTLVAGSSEINLADNAVSTTTLGASTDTEKTATAFGTFPTRAQLVTGTFGVRFRQRRSNTSTITIYSIKATVTYTGNAATTNTEVRAPMSDPTGTLTTGAATGEIRAQVREKGSGTNPTAVITVRNAAGTSLATAVASTAVINPTHQVLSGTFDQSVISDKTDVVVWVTGTGALGGLVEVGAIEWNAQVAAAAGLGFPFGAENIQKVLLRR